MIGVDERGVVSRACAYGIEEGGDSDVCRTGVASDRTVAMAGVPPIGDITISRAITTPLLPALICMLPGLDDTARDRTVGVSVAGEEERTDQGGGGETVARED